MSAQASIGDGMIVLPGAVINAFEKMGKAVICNSSSVIEHECKVDDYAHIAPGAILTGNVSVGKYFFIGANAVIKQRVTIGDHIVIGAGSVVLKDVPSNSILIGNPAKIL